MVDIREPVSPEVGPGFSREWGAARPGVGPVETPRSELPCPPGQVYGMPPCPPGLVCQQRLRCYTPAPGDDGGPDPSQLGGGTLADLLAGIGGGFALPELPQQAVGLAPAERTTVPPFAVLLILGGVAAGGYALYRRSQRAG